MRGDMMKRVLIIALTILAMGISGCTVSTGLDDFTGDAVVEMPDDDFSNPFAIEADDEAEDDIDDDVVVEEEYAGEGDDAADEQDEFVQVELLTDLEGSVFVMEVGEFYSRVFKIADYGAEYEWDVEGLPNNSGLALEKIDDDASKVRLEGTPTSDALGTHQITVKVWDAADPSNEDSTTFTLIVVVNIDEVVIELPPDPCDKPLTIDVVKVGNYSDPDVLDAGEFTFGIGSKVEIEVRARRGDLAPKGSVEWEIASEVERSEHCYFVDDGWLPTDYIYGWVMGETCIGGNALPQAAVESDELEIRKTTNPFWMMDSGPAEATPVFGSYNTKLRIEGRLLYDGPLPVWNLPLDRNAVERLTITARDECESSEEARGSTAFKTFKFGISYPSTVGSDGGDISDMKAYLDYNEVNQYWNGSSQFHVDCSGVEDKYKSVCEAHSQFAVVFTDSDGLDEDILDHGWDMIPALKESIGWVHYDFGKCDDSHDNCDRKSIKSGDEVKSVMDVTRAYLLWVVPTKLKKADKYYGDFNIKRITFKNQYWYGRYRDKGDHFNNNITKNFTRVDRLWELEGMMDGALRYSDGSNKRVLFRRRELAGYVPDFQ